MESDWSLIRCAEVSWQFDRCHSSFHCLWLLGAFHLFASLHVIWVGMDILNNIEPLKLKSKLNWRFRLGPKKINKEINWGTKIKNWQNLSQFLIFESKTWEPGNRICNFFTSFYVLQFIHLDPTMTSLQGLSGKYFDKSDSIIWIIKLYYLHS